MNRGDWQATVCGVAKSWTWLKRLSSSSSSSSLNGGGFPGGLVVKESTCQCRSCRKHWFDPWVGKIPWRRKWQPTPVFLPGESHGQWNLAGYSLWGRKESNMIEQLSTHAHSAYLNYYLNKILSYLAMPCLSMWGLQSSLWRVGSLVASWELLVAACGNLVPWPGIEPRSPALGAWSLSHWTTREVMRITQILMQLGIQGPGKILSFFLFM